MFAHCTIGELVEEEEGKQYKAAEIHYTEGICSI
jgi:hypothetical protein